MQITNRTVTAEDVMALEHCYKPERINGLMPRPMTLRALLDLDTVPVADRLWAVLRLIESPQERCAVSAAIVRRTPLADGRTVWDLLSDERSRAGVSAAEAYSRGEIDEAALRVRCASAGVATDAATEAALRVRCASAYAAAYAAKAANAAGVAYAADAAAAADAAFYAACAAHAAAYVVYADAAEATANATADAAKAAQVAILREMLGAA